MPTPDYPDYTLPIVVIGSVTVVGTVSILGTVTIAGTVSISGTVTVTGDVVVTGAVTVSTIAADNIVIDRLTVTAYKAREAILRNDNGVEGPTAPPESYIGIEYKAKFFPRGCRGTLLMLAVYAKRTGSGTLTLSYSPQPGMAAIGSVEITPDTDWAWCFGAIGTFWNYDSMYIWVSACSGDVSYGHDLTEPWDCIESVDANPPYGLTSERQYFAAVIEGATAGDLPVSGTINTVEIMAEATGGYSGAVTVPTGVVTSVLTITGSGRVTRIKLRVSHSSIFIRFYVDGTLITAESILAGVVLSADQLNALGYAGTTPQIQLLVYALNGLCYFAMQIPFEFRRSFEIRAGHTTGVNEGVIAGVQVNLKR